MRRHLRKPTGVKIREFNARVQEINAYLTDFPPFEENQQLSSDDLLEILEFAIPNTWQKHMVLYNFTPSEHTASEFVEFCERIEFIEQLSPNGSQNGKKGASSQADPKGSNKRGHQRGAKSSDEAKTPDRSGKRQKASKYCPLHDSDSHDISECKVMLDQAKKMREAFANGATKTPGTHKKFGIHKELNVLIEDAVKKALAKTDGSSTSNASDEELEVFNATAELQQLNLNTERRADAYVA